MDHEGKEIGVVLHMMNFQAVDRAFTGSFHMHENWEDDVSLSFRNTTSGQDLGTYEIYVDGEGQTFIYDSLEDVSSDAETEELLDGGGDRRRVDQEVVFIRDEIYPEMNCTSQPLATKVPGVNEARVAARL